MTEQYYSYSPHGGMQYHETKALAQKAADDARKIMIAPDAPYAIQDIQQITWGEVSERAIYTSNGYRLRRQELVNHEQEHPQVVDGRMMNSYGDYIQLKNIKTKDILIHDVVLFVGVMGMALSAKIQRFRGYAIMEILALADVLFEQHGVKRGGSEGNMEFKTYDGRFKLNMCILKTLEFGPEVQIARQKMMQALEFYPSEANDLKTMVTTAYTQVDGKVRVAEVLKLRNFNIENEDARPVWLEALDLIAEALVVATSKKHLRLYRRNDQGGYDPIPLNIAAL